MVYLASSLSLAALELLAHIDYERALNEVQSHQRRLRRKFAVERRGGKLARELGGEPRFYPGAGKCLGGTPRPQLCWRCRVELCRSSARNYLLNPAHPDADRIRPGELRNRFVTTRACSNGRAGSSVHL